MIELILNYLDLIKNVLILKKAIVLKLKTYKYLIEGVILV